MGKKVKLPKLRCNKCGYKWYPRIAARPVKCPDCQNRKWDEAEIKRPMLVGAYKKRKKK